MAAANTASRICGQGPTPSPSPSRDSALVKREGLELAGAFTATLNGELRVGAVEETITVSGETPIVDVQSAKRQQTLTSDVIAAIPTARVYHSIMNLVPGVTTSGSQDVGGLAGPSVIVFAVHGGRLSEGRPAGSMVYRSARRLAAKRHLVLRRDIRQQSGNQLQHVRRSGRSRDRRAGDERRAAPGWQRHQRHLFRQCATGAWQSSNYTDALKAAGLLGPNQLQKIWDVNASFGGPIRKDRVWYYVGGRSQGQIASWSKACTTTRMRATRPSGPTTPT